MGRRQAISGISRRTCLARQGIERRARTGGARFRCGRFVTRTNVLQDFGDDVGGLEAHFALPNYHLKGIISPKSDHLLSD